jgi:uncharacterized protein (TIGR00106 family)
MKIIAEFSLEPIGKGKSMKNEIAEVVKTIQSCGIKHEVNALSTTLEGEWDDVMACLKRCHDKVLTMGVERIATTLKLELRTDKQATIERQKRLAG